MTACAGCGHDSGVHVRGERGCTVGGCACQGVRAPMPEPGDWSPAPPPRAGRGVSRSPEVDAIVAELKANPGQQRVVDRVPGRGAGRSWAYRSRGCQVTTRTDGPWTLVWAWWPDDSTPTKGTK